ncbi:MAG: hypothetical protein R2710_18350 [Acidimicrobiales bacterium]
MSVGRPLPDTSVAKSTVDPEARSTTSTAGKLPVGASSQVASSAVASSSAALPPSSAAAAAVDAVVSESAVVAPAAVVGVAAVSPVLEPHAAVTLWPGRGRP